MNDLEQELRQLAPRGLSRRIRENIRREVGLLNPATPALQHTHGAPGPFRARPVLRAAAVLAAAAGLAVLIYLTRVNPRVGPVTLARVPAPTPVTGESATNESGGSVSVATVLVDEQDEGTVVDSRYGPVRCVRYRFVDNVRWDHPRRGGAVIRQQPREEIVLVSVPVD